jgi:hypothetical protein
LREPALEQRVEGMQRPILARTPDSAAARADAPWSAQ